MRIRRPWSAVQQCLDTLVEVDGGFTLARRGFVRCADGEELFVKIGVNDETKSWATREVATYRFLQEHGYPFAPQLIAYSDDETGFALEALKVEQGWDWSNSWTDRRLAKTLEAMDVLAELSAFAHEVPYFAGHDLSVPDDGWISLATSSDARKILNERIQGTPWSGLLADFDFDAAAERSSGYKFSRDSLVHYDVRADNCAWHAESDQVRLVDWNWAQLNDRKIDRCALLVSVHRSGLDVLTQCPSRLDSGALWWLAGFWFNSATHPSWAPNGVDVRGLQLQSGITAYQLARELDR